MRKAAYRVRTGIDHSRLLADFVRAVCFGDADFARFYPDGIIAAAGSLDGEGVGLCHMGQVDRAKKFSILVDGGGSGSAGVPVLEIERRGGNTQKKQHERGEDQRFFIFFIHRKIETILS